MTEDIPLHGRPTTRPPPPKRVPEKGPGHPEKDVIPPEVPHEPSPERPPDEPVPKRPPPRETAEGAEASESAG